LRKGIAVILLSIVLVGCSVIKRKPDTVSGASAMSESEGFFEEIRSSNLSSGGFYISRADIDISIPAINIKMIGGIKFRYPDSLFVSLRTRTGIEAVRLLMTDDSVLVVDRINRQILYGDPEDLEKKFNISSNAVYAVLGDFVGSPLTPVEKVNCTDGAFYCETLIEGQVLKYEIDCHNMKPGKAFITDNTTGRQVQAIFADFERYGKKTVPGTLKISLMNGVGNFTVEIRNIQTDWNGNTGFVIPGNYRKVRIK